MHETFETELDRLAALQAIDHVIKERKDESTVLKSEVDEIGAELRDCQKAFDTLSAEIAELDRQRIDLEERVKTEGQKIKGGRMRMARIRNEREQLAIQHEINVAKETNEQLENELLAVLEKLEDLHTKVTAAAASLEQAVARSAGETESRQARLEELAREITEQRGRREILMRGMDETLRSRYEQILSRRGGMAVVEVRNGTCQGCHMHVPPQLFNELQKYRDVRQCPNCRRFLFWRANAEQA